MSLKTAYRSGDVHGRPGWRIGFEFDPEKIEALKRAVPYTERSWSESEKLWWVSIEYEDEVLRLFPAFEAYQKQQSMF